MSTKTPIEWARDHEGATSEDAVALAAALAMLVSEIDEGAVFTPTRIGVDVVDADGDTLGTGPTAALAIVDAVKSAYRLERTERTRLEKAAAQLTGALRELAWETAR